MAASATDKFLQTGYSTATTLSAPGYTIGNTSINVGSTTNWPTTTGVIFGVDNVTIVDGEEVRTVGSYCVFVGTVASATSIDNLSLLSGTPQNYAAGALTRVYITISAEHNERLIDGILVSHNQDGTMITSLPLTTPKITTSINDSSGNEVIKTPATASAVNEITVTNAATGNGPIISATGGDTNIDLVLTPKGTGTIKTSAVNKIDWTALPLGSVVQVVNTASSAVATGTTTIPLDDTVPQQTGTPEGDEYMTLAITPKSAANILVIQVILNCANSAAAVHQITALFQDTTASAIAAQGIATTANNSVTFALTHTMAAGTTSATTFKVRSGGSGAGTTTFNGRAGGRNFGAITKSSIVITEYKS